ncbi:MAG: hypothetical protein ACYTEQ_01340 [Planctomycetota bacterium]|jgi:hypothetical protein
MVKRILISITAFVLASTSWSQNTQPLLTTKVIVQEANGDDPAILDSNTSGSLIVTGFRFGFGAEPEEYFEINKSSPDPGEPLFVITEGDTPSRVLIFEVDQGGTITSSGTFSVNSVRSLPNDDLRLFGDNNVRIVIDDADNGARVLQVEDSFGNVLFTLDESGMGTFSDGIDLDAQAGFGGQSRSLRAWWNSATNPNAFVRFRQAGATGGVFSTGSQWPNIQINPDENTDAPGVIFLGDEDDGDTVKSWGQVGILTDPSYNLHVWQTSPTPDQVLVRAGTSDESDRFSLDEDGDMSNFGTYTPGGNILGSLVDLLIDNITAGGLVTASDSFRGEGSEQYQVDGSAGNGWDGVVVADATTIKVGQVSVGDGADSARLLEFWSVVSSVASKAAEFVSNGDFCVLNDSDILGGDLRVGANNTTNGTIIVYGDGISGGKADFAVDNGSDNPPNEIDRVRIAAEPGPTSDANGISIEPRLGNPNNVKWFFRGDGIMDVDSDNGLVINSDNQTTTTETIRIGGEGERDTVELGGRLVIEATQTRTVHASTGITFDMISRGFVRLQGDTAGDTNITSNPQIADGVSDGQVITLCGSNDNQTVTIDNGDGVFLHDGAARLFKGDMISFFYDAIEDQWTETFRNNRLSFQSWGFGSASASGLTYVGGFYDFFNGDDDFDPSPVNFGIVNLARGAHFFVVLGAVTVDELTITITGTSITDGGVRTASDTEAIVIPNATPVDSYFETTKKWNGQISIDVTAGTPKTCNYGFAKYWDSDNTAFRIIGTEFTWLANKANSTSDVAVIHHKDTGWTFNSGAEPTPPTAIARMSTDYSTERAIAVSQSGAYKRDNLSVSIDGGDGEGIIIEILAGTTFNFTEGNASITILDE